MSELTRRTASGTMEVATTVRVVLSDERSFIISRTDEHGVAMLMEQAGHRGKGHTPILARIEQLEVGEPFRLHLMPMGGKDEGGHVTYCKVKSIVPLHEPE